MKPTQEKREADTRKIAGINFIVCHELDKDENKVLFPEKLKKANEMVAKLKFLP
jgi:hypothetical protein